MIRLPSGRGAYVVVQAALIVLIFSIAICYVQNLRDYRARRQSAMDQVGYYQNILKHDPGNVDAIKTLASLYFDLKKLDESREYYGKAATADPDDPESYYSIAVIDWTKAYQLRSQAKFTLGQNEDGRWKDEKACSELKSKNDAGIREGMEMLLRVLEMRPDYKNATFYMGLLWHEKAYIECGQPAAIRSDLKKAQQWMNRKKSVPSYDDSKNARLLVAGVAPRIDNNKARAIPGFVSVRHRG
jgi:tetratricopeptide (TPR) repeat protein